jgi:hypothetical protein
MKSNTTCQTHAVRSRQRGFGMALALAVLAVFAVIAGVIAFANRFSNVSSGSETGKGMAQVVISRGNEIYAAAARGQQDRPIGQIALAATSVAGTSWGLFDPALGLGLTDVPVPGAAFTGGTATSMSLGTSGTSFPAGTGATVGVVATGLTRLVCQHINLLVNAAALDTAPPAVGTNTTVKEGCSTTTGSTYAYYKMLG